MNYSVVNSACVRVVVENTFIECRRILIALT